MTERYGIIKFSGKDQTVIGDDIQVGKKHPNLLFKRMIGQ
jgi:hypothetical protein